MSRGTCSESKPTPALDSWIDLQRAALRTAEEKAVLAEVDTEYDRYLEVSRTIQRERGQSQSPAMNHVRLLNAAAQRMFALADRLGKAHRSALGDLLGQSQRSLRKLEIFFAGIFVMTTALGAWCTRLLFHEIIAPLRRQLVEAESLMRQNEKLASLGMLAAGIAHEIRNPLTAMKMRTYLLSEHLGESSPARNDVNVIDRQIHRLERIVSDFLLFASPGEPVRGTVIPSNLFKETEALLEPELAKRGVRLRIEESAVAEEALRGDQDQLLQVLINLVRNAAESMEDGGVVTLRVCLDRLPLHGHAHAVAVLEVEDNGPGIPTEVRERLFDPFFTTKPTGTGLGLSIAMSILQRHGGTLQFQTTLGSGTTFGMVLPRPATATRAARLADPEFLGVAAIARKA